MPFTLPDLPYAADAFGDALSAESFDYHHGKHHKKYVDETNRLVEAGGIDAATLIEVVRTGQREKQPKLFNNAAQLWNHSFFWQCLSPQSVKMPAALKNRIDADFGSTEKMLKAFKEEATGHFGSGWAWLVLDKDKLAITSYHDADTPIVHAGIKPLLTIDVWEHAYYIDYRNERPKFLDILLGEAINWDFVAENLDGEGAARADQKA